MSTETQSPVTEKFIGRVKWFNSTNGFGFITVTDGPRAGSDVFAHHSAVTVSSQQYKYLVQGEYVEFSLATASGGAHEFQAASITGVKGGKLMCETRRDTSTDRSNYRNSSAKEEDVTWTPVNPSEQNGSEGRGRGGRGPSGRGSNGRGGRGRGSNGRGSNGRGSNGRGSGPL